MDPAEPRRQYYGAWDALAADQASRLKDEEAAEAAASERCVHPSLSAANAPCAAASSRFVLQRTCSCERRRADRVALRQGAGSGGRCKGCGDSGEARGAARRQGAVGRHAGPRGAGQGASRVPSAAAARLALTRTQTPRQLFIEGRSGGAHALDAASLGDKQVVHVRGCRDCVFTLPAEAVLAKLFVEGCTRCAFDLRGRLITGHAEVWSCTDCTVAALAPLPTLQVDLCDALRVRFASRACFGAVVHAGARRLALAVEACEAHPEALEALLGDGDDVVAGDVQFITRLVGGSLLTERVIRDATDYPTTARELREQAALDAGAAAGGAPPSAEEEAAMAAALAARRATTHREAGNACFKSGDYAAAAVSFTAALAAVPGDAAVLSNRAAALLKLGRHAQALEDATAAAEAAPEAAKAHFRRGLALHALARYAEAGPALARAAQLEPRNAQIADALRMTEMALAREARRAAER